jgi:exo-1,4-beta-D-glucosaminidase
MKPETVDWKQATWYFTPTASYADFTPLIQLPMVNLTVHSHTERHGEEQATRVLVENSSSSLAFFVRFKVNSCSDGQEILPVLWQDNYFSLLPGEKREITATYRQHADVPVSVEAGGWNVARFTLPCGR